jgi:hypothetical protein
MLWDIYVPTKGRAGTSQFLNKFGTQLKSIITIAVEPQETSIYKEAYPELEQLPLPANDKGIAFSRQCILDEARSRGDKWFWMIDDDVGRFAKTASDKRICVPCSIQDVLLQAQGVSELPKIKQIALEYNQFAWSAKSDFAFNSYCDVCVAINTNVSASYRGEKEDRDFTMQIIHSGFDTVRLRKLSFTCPANGSNKGGLYEQYQQKEWELAAAKALAERWPWCCSVQTKPNGRVDAKINWRAIRK